MTAVHSVVELLEAMVRIDSANPGLAEDGPGESELAAFVAGWAEAAGLRVEVLEPTSGRPSVLVRGGRGEGGRRLLLCGHLDTVGHAGMHEPLVPRVEGDRLYARGAYDMKAGVAAALVACRDAGGAGLAGEIVVAAVADEEHASLGIQQVLRHLAGTPIDAAIVGEPTELAIGTAHRGFVWTEVTITGVAAHGSRPHLGVDAILKAGPVLVAFADLDRDLARRPHPFLGAGHLHGRTRPSPQRPESRPCSTAPKGTEPTPTSSGSASTPRGPARTCSSPSLGSSAPRGAGSRPSDVRQPSRPGSVASPLLPGYHPYGW